MLFGKRVMGARVVYRSSAKDVCGQDYSNYGSHLEQYPFLPYLTFATAIGMHKSEVDAFVTKLQKCL